MEFTVDEYYRKGHIYLESEGGRREIFSLLERELEKSIEQENPEYAWWVVSTISSYLEESSLIYDNINIPNLSRLRGKSERIREEALYFLGDQIDKFIKVAIKTKRAFHKSKLLFLLVKSMPEIENLKIKYFTDLYLVLFYTLYFLDRMEGSEEERFRLGDLLIKGCSRYDARLMTGYFLKDQRLKELLNSSEYRGKYTLYPLYGIRLRDALGKMEKRDEFTLDVFIPVLFTDLVFYLLNEMFHGLLREGLIEKEDDILLYLNERLNNLFQEDKEVIKGIIEGGIKEKKSKIVHSPLMSEPLIKPQAFQSMVIKSLLDQGTHPASWRRLEGGFF